MCSTHPAPPARTRRGEVMPEEEEEKEDGGEQEEKEVEDCSNCMFCSIYPPLS